MATADSTDDLSVVSSSKRRIEDVVTSESDQHDSASSQKRLCVEESRDSDNGSADGSNSAACDTLPEDSISRSETPPGDDEVSTREVPSKDEKDCDETDDILDSNSLPAAHTENNDLTVTENSSSASVKTEDSASGDSIAAEKDLSTDKNETQKVNDVDTEEPMALALNLTKHSSSEAVPQNAAKTFVIVENDSGNDSLDTPIDLSRGPKSYQPVMVNGPEDHRSGVSMVNGLGCYTDVLNFADVSVIRKCQEELRNEETKLVLLKKIRHSQAVHRLVNDKVAKHPSSSVSSTAVSQSGPPPLVRGGFPSNTMSSHRTSQAHQNAADMSRLHTQAASTSQAAHQSAHGPPPLVMAPRQSSVVTSTNRSSTNTSLTSHGQPMVHNYRPTQTPQQTAEQTAAQRQAAAKVALRRQLEKTLLQIPPPKPPPPEMNFIPNINTNAEFVMLVGLEEAVKCIVDVDAQSNTDVSGADTKYMLTPFECVQCQTDFTPVWKRDRPGSKSVICERCVTTNQKRALKQEHTNRLKGAFVRALQQEQEIEQSLLAGGTTGSSTPPPAQPLVTSSHLSSSRNSSSSLKPGTDASRLYQGISSYPSAPSLRSTSSSVPAMNLPSAAAAAAYTASRLMFPYQQGLVPSSSASRSASSMDLPRQFLLDMIPRRAPVDGQVLWRT